MTEFDMFFVACRPFVDNFDKGSQMGWGKGWSKEDKIRWVEQRLRERAAKEEGRIEDDLDAKGIPDSRSLQCWLAKIRDGLSWKGIAIKFYPEHKKSMSAALSKARRDFNAVENSPNRKKDFKYRMDERIWEVFGCSPQEFKKYINSIRTDDRKK